MNMPPNNSMQRAALRAAADAERWKAKPILARAVRRRMLNEHCIY